MTLEQVRDWFRNRGYREPELLAIAACALIVRQRQLSGEIADGQSRSLSSEAWRVIA